MRATSCFEEGDRKAWPSIDLVDEASLERATAFATDKGELRLVIDATGFLCDESQGPEKSWRQLDAVRLARSFALNAKIRLSEAYAAPARAVVQGRFRDIGDNRLGGWYSYRASKATLINSCEPRPLNWPVYLRCALRRPASRQSRHGRAIGSLRSDRVGKSILPPPAAGHLFAVLDQLKADANGGLFDLRA